MSGRIDFTTRLEDWATVFPASDPYLAPELLPVCLRGAIHEHPSFKNGTRVITPPIVEAEGIKAVVEATEGTKERYEVVLGKVEDGFRAWLQKNRPNWDPENPITVFRKK